MCICMYIKVYHTKIGIHSECMHKGQLYLFTICCTCTPVCCSLQDSDEPYLLPPSLEGREVYLGEERQGDCEGQGRSQHLLATGREALEQWWWPRQPLADKGGCWPLPHLADLARGIWSPAGRMNDVKSTTHSYKTIVVLYSINMLNMITYSMSLAYW